MKKLELFRTELENKAHQSNTLRGKYRIGKIRKGIFVVEIFDAIHQFTGEKVDMIFEYSIEDDSVIEVCETNGFVNDEPFTPAEAVESYEYLIKGE